MAFGACLGDITSGALQALWEAGRRVPDDVALIDFEDSPIARHTNPPLTSLRQPTEEMGRTMARVLLEEIAAHPTTCGAGDRTGSVGVRVGRGSYMLGQALSYPRCSVQAGSQFMLCG
ncbi:substrate-binding domain-containing protein [Streptomyces sp. NPDC058228]|uniref:substrate-binding domain-containing protein n=1 Tax=Streptomyces sp. NPDC058228 TaxID=3346390 RepID=UPI0036EE04F9